MSQIEIHQGDCLDVLRTMAGNSIDSIVTDPPYGLSFMGKKWDYDVPSAEVWAECLRVLKPGGHLLAFAGTRTQHRMAVRIEDAGFEIRDMIAWVYGSGFPKSLNVSKAIASHLPSTFLGPDGEPAWCEECGEAHATVDMEHAIYCAKCAAREWQGWGTALKPALEPITVARKPLVGTVAANVLVHGAGALNIDGCRVAAESGGRPLREVAALRDDVQYQGNALAGRVDGSLASSKAVGSTDIGRWPANLIHDGSDEVLAEFPHSTSGAMKSSTSRAAQDAPGSVCYGTYGGKIAASDVLASSGSAARFFYCAKASKKDRGEGNHHPTVKPTDLMAYLCRLVTPPGGVVLDPFMGSGSTGKAAVNEGFRFIGVERECGYVGIATQRIQPGASQEPPNLDLFESADLAQRAQQREGQPAQAETATKEAP